MGIPMVDIPIDNIYSWSVHIPDESYMVYEVRRWEYIIINKKEVDFRRNYGIY
jgi:hypothetical protein